MFVNTSSRLLQAGLRGVAEGPLQVCRASNCRTGPKQHPPSSTHTRHSGSSGGGCAGAVTHGHDPPGNTAVHKRLPAGQQVCLTHRCCCRLSSSQLSGQHASRGRSTAGLPPPHHVQVLIPVVGGSCHGWRQLRQQLLVGLNKLQADTRAGHSRAHDRSLAPEACMLVACAGHDTKVETRPALLPVHGRSFGMRAGLPSVSAGLSQLTVPACTCRLHATPRAR